MSNRQQTVRVATFDWEGTVLEGLDNMWMNRGEIENMPHYPHELPPLV